MEAIIISRNSYLISLYIETEINIRPMTYVGQYKNEYKTNQSTSVHDEEINISYAKLMKGKTNGMIPTTSKIFQRTLFFIQIPSRFKNSLNIIISCQLLFFQTMEHKYYFIIRK